MHNVTNFATRDDLARQCRGGVFHVVETNQRFDPGQFGRFNHLTGIGGRQRQGFFRIDMFTVTNGRQRHLFVQMIG
ncbi:hypothetical protein D3C72_2135230 [compost metagenome]